jgi:hypothetical protein
MTDHIHRWQLGADVGGITPARCACGAERVFTDEPAGPRGRLKRGALTIKRPAVKIVEPIR